MKTLVLFVTHELNDRSINFIKNAIFRDDDTDFILILNGGKTRVDYDANANIFKLFNNIQNTFVEVPSYVRLFFRDNIGHDFGGWSDALISNNLYKEYDNFIFVNSSVIGPFLSPDYTGKWTDIYLNGLKNNVKLFGSTINSCSDPENYAHIQSYIFAADTESVEHLIQCEIFSNTNYASNKDDAVWQKEVKMSRKIIERGWNIGSLLPYYRDVDFTFATKPYCEWGKYSISDVMWPAYENIYWKREELVFIKGNRVNM